MLWSLYLCGVHIYVFLAFEVLSSYVRGIWCSFFLHK